MFTIFLSNLISIFWVQIPEVFSMASSLRIPSAGYTRSFSGDTVNVAKCSNKYAGDRPPSFDARLFLPERLFLEWCIFIWRLLREDLVVQSQAEFFCTK